VNACNQIESSKTLDQDDILRLKEMRLLEKDETVYKFYSEYRKDVSGNFFTDLRIATYWIDKRNSKKNEIEFAYYSDIANIDTVYYAGLTYTPYMLVTRKDSSNFRVSVDGEREEVKLFFETALREWKQKNKQ
jgi:hypothetical protein